MLVFSLRRTPMRWMALGRKLPVGHFPRVRPAWERVDQSQHLGRARQVLLPDLPQQRQPLGVFRLAECACPPPLDRRRPRERRPSAEPSQKMLLRRRSKATIRHRRQLLHRTHVLLEQAHRCARAIAADPVNLPARKEADRLQRLLHGSDRHRLVGFRRIRRKRQLVASVRGLVRAAAGDRRGLPKVGVTIGLGHAVVVRTEQDHNTSSSSRGTRASTMR